MTLKNLLGISLDTINPDKAQLAKLKPRQSGLFRVCDSGSALLHASNFPFTSSDRAAWAFRRPVNGSWHDVPVLFDHLAFRTVYRKATHARLTGRAVKTPQSCSMTAGQVGAAPVAVKLDRHVQLI
jgi:hypothetical protein